MSAYRCRAIAPSEAEWAEVTAASPEDALQAYHADHEHLGINVLGLIAATK